MENVNDKIQRFTSIYKNNEDSNCCIYGEYDDGSGIGAGDGLGFGDYGDGYGSYGECSLRGSGGKTLFPICGEGLECGRGYGGIVSTGCLLNDDIVSFCGQTVYYIDDIPTVIQKVKGNLTKGYIINSDLTTKPCYIAKGNGYFAHGDTFRGAQNALRAKIFENMDTEEAIDEFLKTFHLGVKYPAKDFYEWHHILTGSCEFGRNTFVKNYGIDLEKDTYTVEEFIEITCDDYGSDVIRQLAERVQNENS